MPLFVTDPIRELDRCCLQLTCGRDVNVVLLERPPLGEDRVYGCLWVRGVFKVAIHQQLLRLRT